MTYCICIYKTVHWNKRNSISKLVLKIDINIFLPKLELRVCSFWPGPFWTGPFWHGPFWHGPFWHGPFWPVGVGRAPSMLGCSLIRINFGGARLARYSNLDARCSLDTRRAFFRPQIGRFWANSWLNLGKIMELFNTKKFSYIFGWKSAQNRPILGPFLAKYVT